MTLGRIDHQTSVADRLSRVPATGDSCAIFIALLDNTDDTWQRPRIAGQAIDMLRTWQPATSAAYKLRTRLVDLGYFDARHIVLPGDTST